MLKEAKRQFKYDQKKLRNLETGQAITSVLILYTSLTLSIFRQLHFSHFFILHASRTVPHHHSVIVRNLTQRCMSLPHSYLSPHVLKKSFVTINSFTMVRFQSTNCTFLVSDLSLFSRETVTSP